MLYTYHTQPVITVCLSKSLPVGLPCAVKINRATNPSLNHLFNKMRIFVLFLFWVFFKIKLKEEKIGKCIYTIRFKKLYNNRHHKISCTESYTKKYKRCNLTDPIFKINHFFSFSGPMVF